MLFRLFCHTHFEGSKQWRRSFLATIILFPCLASSQLTLQAFAKSSINPEPDASLSNTDGFGLLPKTIVPELTKAEAARKIEENVKACNTKCVTPFGTLLGQADGVPAVSNCRSTCVRPELSFFNLKTGSFSIYKDDPKQPELKYIGLTYQCVEYARKWWMKNLGITFGSVGRAYEIIYLQTGKKIANDQEFPLARSINGTAKRPPARGDLIIYYADVEVPDWQAGHVAVVLDRDISKGAVSIAEENYDNKPWQNPIAFARQLRLLQIGGRYTLVDVAPDSVQNPTGGRIAGWVYPAQQK